MARYVGGSASAAFGQGLFGQLSSGTMSYLQNQISQLSLGGDFRKELVERSQKLFQDISSSAAFQMADAVLMQAEACMGQDIIEYLSTVQQMQTAASQMQYWIMENPYMREQWQKGRIEGYTDTYVDPEPGAEGEARSGHQKLWHGVLREHEEQSWTMSLYAGRDEDAARELPVRRIAAIIDTQEAAEWLTRYGEDDVTSQYGAKL